MEYGQMYNGHLTNPNHRSETPTGAAPLIIYSLDLGIIISLQTGHLAGIEKLYEIDFNKGIDLPPFGKCVDACNNQYQFDSGIGSGYYSSDLEKSQEVLASIKIFKARYPEVRLAFGHDY